MFRLPINQSTAKGLPPPPNQSRTLREDPKLGRRRFLAAFSQTVRPALARNVFRRGLLESLAPRTQPGQRYHFSCSDSFFFPPYFQGCLAPLSSSAPLHAPPLHAVRNTYGASSSVWRLARCASRHVYQQAGTRLPHSSSRSPAAGRAAQQTTHREGLSNPSC